MARKSSVNKPKVKGSGSPRTLSVKALMDYVADGLVIIDQAGKIREFNRAAGRIFGYSRSEVVGRDVNMLIPEPDRKDERSVARYLQTGRAKMVGVGREVQGKRKDGTTFPMGLSIGEIPGSPARWFVGSIRDLTERKALERQLLHSSRMEAIGQLSGGIAHDFNNLLAVLMIDLEILEELTGNRENCREIVQEALDVTRSAADLTRSLLAFSRRQPLQPTTVDVSELIQDAIGLLKRTLGGAFEIESSTSTDLWPIRIDRGQLESSLLNLALNARDAMPNGGRLTFTAANVSHAGEGHQADLDLPPGDYVRIDVRDTGSGLNEEALAHAFEPFFARKPGREPGLSLATVYGFARQSGGHAQIESALSGGTTVTLFLPRAEASQNASQQPGRARAGGGKKILVVEDDTRLRKRGRLDLDDLGYAAFEAANGAEALRILEATPDISLLFTDIVMPGGMDGVELAKRALARQPGLKVLLTSGYAEYTDADVSAISSGILRKPYRRRELADRIRAAIESD
jgi:PAS domain S-box-containing protein